MSPIGSRPRPPKASGLGYSLVEVTVVIAVASILTVSILSRTSNDEFDRVLVQDALLSVARLTQQSAFGRQRVSLHLQLSDGDLSFGSKLDGTLQSTAVFDGSDFVMTLGPVTNINAISCGALAALTNYDLDFNDLGDVAHPLGFQICLNQSPIVCISSAGFAHKGVCE